MNTFQLRCFLAVANSLSFARAAQQMNISQPAVTHQIKTLEQELKVALFRRTTRRVELTPEGRSFLADARSIVAIEAQAKLRFLDPEDKPVERLSIACGSPHTLALLPPSLAALRKRYPNLHPHLSTAPREQLFQLLENGTADVALTVFDSRDQRPRMTYHPLADSPMVCVCRDDHPLVDEERISLDQLADQELIFCDPIRLIGQAARLQWQLAEGRDPARMHFCHDIETAVILAQAGFGLTILPSILVPQTGILRQIPLQDGPSLSFGAFHPASGENEILKTFLYLLTQDLQKK